MQVMPASIIYTRGRIIEKYALKPVLNYIFRGIKSKSLSKQIFQGEAFFFQKLFPNFQQKKTYILKNIPGILPKNNQNNYKEQ